LLDDSRESTRPEAPRERLRTDALSDRSGGWSNTVGRLRIVLPPAGKHRLAGATGVGRERTEHGRDREACWGLAALGEGNHAGTLRSACISVPVARSMLSYYSCYPSYIKLEVCMLQDYVCMHP